MRSLHTAQVQILRKIIFLRSKRFAQNDYIWDPCARPGCKGHLAGFVNSEKIETQ